MSHAGRGLDDPLDRQIVGQLASSAQAWRDALMMADSSPQRTTNDLPAVLNAVAKSAKAQLLLTIRDHGG
jgi:hypothetical protein